MTRCNNPIAPTSTVRYIRRKMGWTETLEQNLEVHKNVLKHDGGNEPESSDVVKGQLHSARASWIAYVI